MRPVHAPAAVLLVLLVVPMALAPAVRADDFDADRPDFTNGTSVLPGRTAQVELGWTRDHFASGESDDTFGESLLRLGLGHRLELRWQGPDWNRARAPGMFESGLGSVAVGMKLRLSPPGQPFSTGLLGQIGIPGGAGSFGHDAVDLAATLVGELDGEHAGIAANFTLSREGPLAARVWSGALTLSANRELAPGWSGFLEWYEVLDDTDHRPDFVDTGVLWMAAPRTQLDLRAGERIDRGERHTFFGAGVSQRF